MSYFWHYIMDPEFQMNIVDYTAHEESESMHWHDYLQITVCVEGRGKFLFQNKEYTAQPGDVFVVSNFESHVALAEPGEEARFILFIFMPEFIAPPGSRKFDFEYLYPFRYNAKTFRNKIDASIPQAQRIATMIPELKAVLDSKGEGYRHQLDAGLRQILATLIGYFKETYKDYCTTDTQSQHKMHEAVSYINENFLYNLKLEDLAQQFHLSVSRFRHVFRETIHIGFKEYITYLRLSESRRLLMTTDLNITDIANQSGFSNIYQFYKVFNKYVFMSPAQYRKRYGMEPSVAVSQK